MEHLHFYSKLKGIAILNTVTFDSFTFKNQILQQVGLENSKHKLVKELSGGMIRRLSLAISTIGNPSFILLDEPTTGLKF
jgi:ABC-2 type transport system ATP-binding protein